MNRIETIHILNITSIQYTYDVDEITSFYMAEALTAEDMGYA